MIAIYSVVEAPIRIPLIFMNALEMKVHSKSLAMLLFAVTMVAADPAAVWPTTAFQALTTTTEDLNAVLGHRAAASKRPVSRYGYGSVMRCSKRTLPHQHVWRSLMRAIGRILANGASIGLPPSQTFNQRLKCTTEPRREQPPDETGID
ncbi:hypothetical protein PABG_12061 [Paracoccidioides brasiliensis Pb03]|nr:hypothetical protein PABG_12061 [Paracoccidioides brasiliensis Pb03]